MSTIWCDTGLVALMVCMLCKMSGEPQVSYEEGCAMVVHAAGLNRRRPIGIRLRPATGQVSTQTLLVYQWCETSDNPECKAKNLGFILKLCAAVTGHLGEGMDALFSHRKSLHAHMHTHMHVHTLMQTSTHTHACIYTQKH